MSCDICAQVDDIIQLNPVDLYFNECVSIPWAVFYSYDISTSTLKDALHKIAVEYPVICGRLVSNPTTRMQVVTKKGTGFRLTDIKSDSTLLEAISESRVSNQVAKFPSYAELPHSLEDLNLLELIDRDAPVFKVKLIHYKDGTCSLAVTLHHAIADAQRLANLMVDITRAYHGQCLSKIDHDRSRLWPDVFLKSIDVGLSRQDFPRECKIKDENPGHYSFPNDTYSMESIYFPKPDIDLLKQRVMAALDGEVNYVSQVDVLSAIHWMLRCELNAVRKGFKGIAKTVEDLQIRDTQNVFFMELLTNNSKLIPENYFGNGFLWAVSSFPNTCSKQNRNNDLFGVLVEASAAIREQILENRCPEKHALKLLQRYRLVNEPDESPSFPSILTSYCKMPFEEMDFGQGPPVFNYALSALPFHYPLGSLAQNVSDEGMIVNMPILESEEQRFLNSAVLKTLFPKVRFLSQMSIAEWTQFLSMTSIETKD